MKCMMLLLGGTFICFQGESQAVRAVPENGYISAGAYSIHGKNAFSFYSNAASPAMISGFSAGMLTERKWMLPELADVQTALCFPVAHGGCGVGFQYSGNRDYSEQTLNGVYAKSLGRMNLGVRFNFLMAKAGGYAAAGFLSSGIGFLYAVSDRLVTGWELGLPVSGISGKIISEKNAPYYRLGFGYAWRPDLLMVIQISQSQRLPVDVTGSIEYTFEEQFFFSLGMSSLTGSVFFKSGWRKNKLSVMIYTLFEPVLGFSPSLLLLYERKNSNG